MVVVTVVVAGTLIAIERLGRKVTVDQDQKVIGRLGLRAIVSSHRAVTMIAARVATAAARAGKPDHRIKKDGCESGRPFFVLVSCLFGSVIGHGGHEVRHRVGSPGNRECRDAEDDAAENQAECDPKPSAPSRLVRGHHVLWCPPLTGRIVRTTDVWLTLVR
jgi:hypothetical protein